MPQIARINQQPVMSSQQMEFCYAVRRCSFDDCKSLLGRYGIFNTDTNSSGINVNFQNSNGWHLINSAARDGSTGIVILLLENGANPNAKNPHGISPLYDAVNRGDFRMVESLLSCGADVDIRTNVGITPLHIAVQRNNFEMVQFLLENGATRNAETSSGHNVLDDAKKNGNNRIIELLKGRMIPPPPVISGDGVSQSAESQPVQSDSGVQPQNIPTRPRLTNFAAAFLNLPANYSQNVSSRPKSWVEVSGRSESGQDDSDINKKVSAGNSSSERRLTRYRHDPYSMESCRVDVLGRKESGQDNGDINKKAGSRGGR